MVSFLDRIKTWWITADRNQRVVTLGGLGALVLLLVGTAFFVTRPHYVSFISGLSEEDKSEAVAALEAAGYHPQTDRPGELLIAEGDKYKARAALASANKLPKGNHHWGENDLSKLNAFTTPGAERETLNTIQEGEIASSLEAMEGVASANVLITNPQKSVFAADKVSPSASVTIVEDGHGVLTHENGRTIASLVCSAVDGMRPENVVVVSNTLGELWNGNDANNSGTKSELDGKVARYWEAKLQAALDVPFGLGNTKVVVRADVDTSRRRLTEREVTPAAKPRSVVTEKESMTNGVKKPGGNAGTASNTSEKAAAAAPNGGDGKGSYEKSGSQKDYDKNETERVTEGGDGDLKGLAIAIVVNSDKVTDEKKVKELVDGVMGGRIELDENGIPKRNQPFSTTVTSVKFDGSAAQAAKEAADRVASQQRTQQMLSLLPIGAILLVALLVAKQVGKISRSVLPSPPEPTAALAEGPDALPDGGGGAAYDALPAPIGLDEEEQVALEQFRDRIDVPLQSLKQMAAERPEMVATLIKSMMLGEMG